MIVAEAVNFSSAWTGLWGKVNQGDFSEFMMLMTYLGVALVVFAIGKFFWDKRRGGGGGGSQTVLWAAIAGAVFAAPNLVFPLVLGLVDIIVNTFARVFGG